MRQRGEGRRQKQTRRRRGVGRERDSIAVQFSAVQSEICVEQRSAPQATEESPRRMR